MPPEKRRKREANGSDNSDSSSGSESAMKVFNDLLRSRWDIYGPVYTSSPSTSQAALDEQRTQINPSIVLSSRLSRICQEICKIPCRTGGSSSAGASTSTAATLPLSPIRELLNDTIAQSVQARVPTSSNETSSRGQDRSTNEPRNFPVTPSTVSSALLLPHRLSSAVSVLTRVDDRASRPGHRCAERRYGRGPESPSAERRRERRYERSRRPHQAAPTGPQRPPRPPRPAHLPHQPHLPHLPHARSQDSPPGAPGSVDVPTYLLISSESRDNNVREELANGEVNGLEFALTATDEDLENEISEDEQPAFETSHEAEGMEDLTKKILSTMECPVCFELMAPPMSQCRRGHLVCTACRQRLNSCPTCRAPFTNRRNLYIERITEMLQYPCRHAGCSVRVDLSMRVEHEENCRLRPRFCSLAQGINGPPLPACVRPCLVPTLLRHYKTNHRASVLEGPVHQLKVWLSQHDWIIIAHKRMFHFNVTTNSNLMASVQYYGQQQNCRDFLYSIELRCSGAMSRNYHYTRRVHSDLTTVADLMRSYDTFCVPTGATKKFEQCVNGDLEIRVEIVDVRERKDASHSDPVQILPSNSGDDNAKT